jgi:hypothetical protein
MVQAGELLLKLSSKIKQTIWNGVRSIL